MKSIKLLLIVIGLFCLTVGKSNAETQLFGQSGTGSNNNDPAYIVYYKFTAVASGTLDTFRIQAFNSGNIKIGLFTDNSNAPGTYLFSNQYTLTTGSNDVTVTSTSITSGTVYWVGVQNQSTSVFEDITTGGTRKYNTHTYADPWSDNPPTSGTDSHSGAVLGLQTISITPTTTPQASGAAIVQLVTQPSPTPMLRPDITNGVASIVSGTSSTADVTFGLTPDSSKVFVGFTITPNQNLELCTVKANLRKYGNPTDDIALNVYAGGSYTSGTYMGTAVNMLSGYALTTSYTEQTFFFGNGALGFDCPALKSGTKYWLGFTRSGAKDSSNYYSLRLSNSSTGQTNSYWYKSVTTSAEDTNYHIYGSINGYGLTTFTRDTWATLSAQLTGLSGQSWFHIAAPECGAFQPICSGFTDIVNSLMDLIIPPDESGKLNAIVTTIQNRAPFGYIYLVGTNMLNLAVSGSGSSSMSFTVPITTADVASAYSIPETMTLSTNNTALEPWRALIRNSIAFLLWASLVMYILFRFSHRVM